MLINNKIKKKSLDIFISISFLKGLFLHLLAPLFGYYTFLKYKKISHSIKSLFLLCLYAIILGIFYKDGVSIGRSFQFLGITLFIQYLYIQKNRIDFKFIAKLLTALGLVVLIYDIIFFVPALQKPILGLKLLRFKGLLREYNFSAAVYLGCFYIFLSKRLYKLSMFSLLLVLTTGSRAGILAAIIAIFLYLINSKILNKTILVLVLLYPLFIFFTATRGINFQNKINNFSSKRVALQLAVLDIVKEKPLGVGYFRGRSYLAKYRETSKLPYQAEEPHNLLFQLFLEFGIFGFLFWIYLIFRTWISNKVNFYIPGIMIMFSFLNGTHEIIIYLMLIMNYRSSLKHE